MKDGNEAAYRRGLIAHYGVEAVETLERRRHEQVKLSDKDFETLTEFFKQKTTSL